MSQRTLSLRAGPASLFLLCLLWGQRLQAMEAGLQVASSSRVSLLGAAGGAMPGVTGSPEYLVKRFWQQLEETTSLYHA